MKKLEDYKHQGEIWADGLEMIFRNNGLWPKDDVIPEKDQADQSNPKTSDTKDPSDAPLDTSTRQEETLVDDIDAAQRSE